MGLLKGLAANAAAALLLALTGGLVALFTAGPPGASAGSSANHRPAVATAAPSLPRPGPPLTASAVPASCQTAALTVSQRTVQVAAGTALVSAEIANAGPVACTLGSNSLGDLAADVLGLAPDASGDLPATIPSRPGTPSVARATPDGGPPPQGANIAPGSTFSLQMLVPDGAAGGGQCTLSVGSDVLPAPVPVTLPESCVAPPAPGQPGGASLPPDLLPLTLPSLSLPPVPSVPSLPVSLPASAPAVPSVSPPALPAPSQSTSVPGLPAVPGVLGLPSLPSSTLLSLPASLPSLPVSLPPLPASPIPIPGLPGGISLSSPGGGSGSPSSSQQPSAPPARYSSGSTGYDISWPQCGGSYPPKSAVAVVGVNDGRAFTTNPCLSSEAAWAAGNLDLYMNLNSPTAADSTDQSGPDGNCGGNDDCLAYNYGYNAARSSLQVASGQNLTPRMWWLDIETAGGCGNAFPTGGSGYWSCNQQLNSLTIQGALDAVRQAGMQVGVYSTSYQWGVITGGYQPSGGAPPNWVPGDNASPASSWCDGSHDFAGASGAPWLLQLYPSQQFDSDEAC